MTAFDPAVAAAQRADEVCDGTWIDGGRELAVTAAREMAAPIRELHEKLSRELSDAGVRHVLDLLAPLIYSEEEL